MSELPLSTSLPDAANMLDEQDRQLINLLQSGFPLCSRPFEQVGAELGLAEEEVLSRLQRLLEMRVLTRFGPMYQIERAGGAFCLAAMHVPDAVWTQVCEIVNRYDEVAHNYQREHRLNMWFVLATEYPDDINRCARQIEQETGLDVHLFPKEREYFIGLKLEA